MRIENDGNIFRERLKIIKDHFSEISNDTVFKWENISAILMLEIKGNWTVQSKNSNYQINSQDVSDFFPILQISNAFPHWRLTMPGLVSKKIFDKLNINNFTLFSSTNWLIDKISYRHKLQNGYPYLQLTFGDKLMLLKNALHVNDQIFFLKEKDSKNYFIFATKTHLFSEDKILIYDQNITSREAVSLFEPEEIPGIELIKGINFNQIYYGAPGTGKSKKIEDLVRGYSTTRTTFHPDTDYAAFIGCYKPTKHFGEDNKITYKFIPQSFIKAYVKAWKDRQNPHFLIIEEINRGNCAQIFGDMFQLLDRADNGCSKYVVDADTDLAEYLKEEMKDIPNYLNEIKILNDNREADYSKMALPNNLYILASMNTSDQSLFPMDSAFKRRWCWEYVPIDLNDAKEFKIQIDDLYYKWEDFLRKINAKIQNLEHSEDKQLGNRFVNPSDKIINFDEFRSKVLFYLWAEIYKDEMKTAHTIFRISDEKDISFAELFTDNTVIDKENIKKMLDYNEIEKD